MDEGTEGEDTDLLSDRLAELIGQPVGSDTPSVAPDPVNQPMIRHWAAAFEDRNPVYTDPDLAAKTRFGGIVAPPLMLQTWTMATPTITGIAERGGSPVESDGRRPAVGLRRRRFQRDPGHRLRVRDRPLPPARGDGVGLHGGGVHLGGEIHPARTAATS